MIVQVLAQKNLNFGEEPTFSVVKKIAATTYREGASEKIIANGQTMQVDALLTLTDTVADGATISILTRSGVKFFEVLGSNASASFYYQVKLRKIPAVKVV